MGLDPRLKSKVLQLGKVTVLIKGIGAGERALDCESYLSLALPLTGQESSGNSPPSSGSQFLSELSGA